MTFQFVSTSASALHTQITQHHGLVLDVVRKNRSNMCKHIVYCISFAKNRAIFAEILCGAPNINGRGI